MANQVTSRLPSATEFPDVIHPVTAKDYSALRQAFGVGSNKRSSAEIRYERLSAQIAAWTGHEHAVDQSGRPFNRAEWQVNLFRSLNHLNNELKLGMDRQMVDVLTLCYTALQETPRFGGDPVIEPKKGENTAVHSIHTMLQAFRVYQKALESKPDLGNDLDFFRSFQMTCLIMSVHDLGEMFGEAGSLAQVSHAGNWGAKDKTAYERMVFNYGVRLAIQTIIDKKGTEQDFFNKIDKIKAGTNIQNEGANKTDQQMVSEVSHFLKDEIPLSPRAQKLFSFLEKNWEWIEEPKHSRNPFLGYLSAVCERVQGTRHLNRMMETSQSPHVLPDGKTEMLMTHKLMDSKRLLINAEYTEGNLGPMCHAINPHSTFEESVARQALVWTYETIIDFYRDGPEAFSLDQTLKELRLHTDGSAFNPDEVSRRLSEIERVKEIAKLEGCELGRNLVEEFTSAAIPIGRNAAARENVLSLYERAIEIGYMPGIINVAGKECGEILIRDLPEKLTGVNQSSAPTYPEEIVKKIESLKAYFK